MKCNKLMMLIAVILLSLFLFGTNTMADTAIVNTETLKLRKEASTDATILELLDRGEKLEVLEQTDDWVKVKVRQMTGYVHKDYIKIEQTQNNATLENQNTENSNVENSNTEKENIESQNTESQNTANEIQNTVGETITNETTTNENNATQEQKEFTIREATLNTNTTVFILPLLNATKIGNLNKNATVMVMDEVTNWAYIQTDTISGWVFLTTLAEQNNTTQTTTQNTTQPTNDTPNEKEETPIENKVMYVNYSSVYVRKGPSTKEESIDSLILNAQVTVLAEVEDWYKVEVDGKIGYIAKRLLSSSKTETASRSAEERTKQEEPKQEQEQEQVAEVKTETTSANSSKAEEIINYAKQYLGCPYVYGGAGPSSFDCSGFTMYVYAHFGISLSHSARAQAKNGSNVAKSDLQPGDLVFFKDYETMDGIGHCGIYIGEGNFIHASSGTGYCVKISTLLSGSYATRYETARRII